MRQQRLSLLCLLFYEPHIHTSFTPAKLSAGTAFPALTPPSQWQGPHLRACQLFQRCGARSRQPCGSLGTHGVMPQRPQWWHPSSCAVVKADAYGHGAVESGTIEQVRVVLATASRGAAVPALCFLLSWWSAYFLLVEVSLPPQWCTSVTAVVCVVSPVFLLEPRKEDKCGPGDAAALLSTSALCVSSAASWCSYNRLGQAFGGMPSIAALPGVIALGAAHCFVLACQLRRLTSSPQESPVSAHRESIDSLQAELIRNGSTPHRQLTSLSPHVYVRRSASRRWPRKGLGFWGCWWRAGREAGVPGEEQARFGLGLRWL